MNYLGILYNDADKPSAYALIHKNLENMIREYTLLSIGEFDMPLKFSDIEAKIDTIYNDQRLVKIKTVFSQEGRPPKTVHAKPYIIGGFKHSQENPFEGTRKTDISVECLYIQNKGSRQPVPDAPRKGLLGDNFAVTPEKLKKVSGNVFKENRITIGKETDIEKKLSKVIREGFLKPDEKTFFDGRYGHLFQTITLILWYNEKVRKIKRY